MPEMPDCMILVVFGLSQGITSDARRGSLAGLRGVFVIRHSLGAVFGKNRIYFYRRRSQFDSFDVFVGLSFGSTDAYLYNLLLHVITLLPEYSCN